MLKQIRQYIENLWLSILAISISMAVFGVIAVIAPDWTITAIIQILAVILLFFGCISFVQIFSNLKQERSVAGAVISTLIFIATGLTLLLSPGFSLDLVLTVIGVVVLLRGVIDIVVGLGVQKDEADKILLDLHNVSKSACIHPSDKVWIYNGKRFCEKCNSWLEQAVR